MATFVLVHGGGHGGWCFAPVARRLRVLGHEVHAPSLTGLADRAHLLGPAVTLDTHIEDIARLIVFEDLNEVILAGHSYGGMVITGVADRVAGRLRRLVYLDASIPENGESVASLSPGLAAFAGVRMVDGVALGLWPEQVAGPLYGLTDPALRAWAMERLTPHPWATMEQPLRLANPDAVAILPRAMLNCAQTLARRDPAVRGRWLSGSVVHEIDTGHDLMLTEPEAVATFLHDVAGNG